MNRQVVGRVLIRYLCGLFDTAYFVFADASTSEQIRLTVGLAVGKM